MVQPQPGADSSNEDNLRALMDTVESSDPTAAAALLPRMYDELKRLAASQLRDQPTDHTLQPTALVNEAFLKLAGQGGADVKDRTHFFVLASKVMRQVLIDHARAKQAAKRGGDWQRITLSGMHEPSGFEDIDLLSLNEVLNELASLSERKARLVELRFFAGLTEIEAARVLGISRTEATRQWRMTRAWLSKRLRETDEG